MDAFNGFMVFYGSLVYGMVAGWAWLYFVVSTWG